MIYKISYFHFSKIGYSWEGDTKCDYAEESAFADAASNFIIFNSFRNSFFYHKLHRMPGWEEFKRKV